MSGLSTVHIGGRHRNKEYNKHDINQQSQHLQRYTNDGTDAPGTQAAVRRFRIQSRVGPVLGHVFIGNNQGNNAADKTNHNGKNAEHQGGGGIGKLGSTRGTLAEVIPVLLVHVRSWFW